MSTKPRLSSLQVICPATESTQLVARFDNDRFHAVEISRPMTADDVALALCRLAEQIATDRLLQGKAV